ncbi:MAG: hypothetical protein DRJ10_07755 [Bacteroidetes bacterium]|nr:MAG: hypothetical protein DRJ10_07755 [Bacteroidota bacterium]
MKLPTIQINLKDKSILTLIAVNVFPIIGVFFLGWDIFEVVTLYVLETFIIGLFNIFKMFFVKDGGKPFLIPFFFIHYNGFILIQSVFVLILIGGEIDETGFLTEGTIDSLYFTFTNRDFIIAILLIIFSRGVSFFRNFIKQREFENVKLGNLMFAPYKRIFIQQLMVIVGAIIVILFDAPMGLLIILIILKTFLDLRAHNKSHTA